MSPADRLFIKLQVMAMDGKVCPKNSALDTSPVHFRTLVREGKIRVDDAKIYRVVHITSGPHAGKSTVAPVIENTRTALREGERA